MTLANEKTVPLLPCRSIDEIVEFYEMLGFEQTYYQVRPNPCVGLRREDLHLQFFGMPDFEPENSYGTCIVAVPDTGELFQAFADGMRAVHGKLLVSRIPRITRPRARKNADGVSGFSVVDPGGNWIRIFADHTEDTAPVATGLAAALQTAIVQGDSRGSEEHAARVLDNGLRRHGETAAPADLLEALLYRAELALRVDDLTGARDFLARAKEVPHSDYSAGMRDLETALAERGDRR
ncbi:hypothetical protein AB5J62_31340 [Amycolatopsis sp. cg5]|uniref:hypothetical protein n=1 Tax=Amycolatopsis sp. cg5 TaxID=3238802 RepID=UPI0035249127